MKNLIERTVSEIAGFEKLRYKVERNLINNGKSRRTYKAYIHHIASVSLHFKRLPFDISDEEIADYLFEIKTTKKYSETFFKFTVYGLRFLFKIFRFEDRKINLPSLPKNNSLPVILSKSECKRLFKTPKRFKDRFLLCLIYSAGLRLSEVQKLEVRDIDTDRMSLHVREGKGKKDRYIVLSRFIANRFKKYCNEYNIEKYVFPGQKKGNYVSKTTIQRIMRETVKSAKITKPVNLHTLRHCFASHLLENGVDIITVKEQMGHVCIQTTMMYLQVSNLQRTKSISPLDNLYNYS